MMAGQRTEQRSYKCLIFGRLPRCSLKIPEGGSQGERREGRRGGLTLNNRNIFSVTLREWEENRPQVLREIGGEGDTLLIEEILRCLGRRKRRGSERARRVTRETHRDEHEGQGDCLVSVAGL
jgi:hypothetical protein